MSPWRRTWDPRRSAARRNHPDGMISERRLRRYRASTGQERDSTMLRRIVSGTAVVALALTVAGCGSDSDSSSSTTTSAQSAVCKDKTALEDSVKSLTNLDLATAGEGKIDSDAQDVQDNLDALGKSVKANLKPEVDALKAAVQDLEDAVKGFGDQSITQSIQDAGSAISKVGSTGADLAKKLDSECPS
jgi:hypothetical protein